VSPRDLSPGADDEGPALVRPYALVRGRTRTSRTDATPVESIVVSTNLGASAAAPLERGSILRMCEIPHSLAEVSALLHLPIGVVRVLVADLEGEGYVHINLPAVRQPDGSVDRALLERVLAGLEAL
jgi:hypothetical protein